MKARTISSNKRKFLVASIAGLMAVAGTAVMPMTAHAEGVHCYGVNSCKGTGDCGGKGHSCAGKNSCKGQGYKSVASAEACLAMEGGSLTAPAN